MHSAIDTFVGVRSPTVVTSLKFATAKRSLLPAAVDIHFGNYTELHLCVIYIINLSFDFTIQVDPCVSGAVSK